MEEITRYQQLRQAQLVSEEQKNLLGLPLYPGNKLSTFAENLQHTKAESYIKAINEFKENKSVLKDTNKINPMVKTLYDWIDFKAKPLKLADFTAIVATLNPKDMEGIATDWTLYADNLLFAVYNKSISVKGCVDFQMLVRICYILSIAVVKKANNLIVVNSFSDFALNEIINRPVLLPPGILNNRCNNNCDEMRPIELPVVPSIKINRDTKCEPMQDDACKPPSDHCICIRTYVGDLFIVKEELARYEEGDIADIENILAGEKKVHRHRSLLRTEESTEDEKQTDTSEEKDHQVNEKFTLQSEVKNLVDSKVNVDAGVTATIKYGSTATITPHANVTANFSKSESENIARSYAKELIDRSVSKIQEKVRTLRISKAISELEERNKHVIDNTKAGADHRAGIYYWVNKVTHAQVFNYGKHTMFDLIIPEPAAIFKKLFQSKINSDAANSEPVKPSVTPAQITRTTYGSLLNDYAITSTDDLQPPEEFTAVQIAFGKSITEPEHESTATGFDSGEVKSPQIPKGYKAIGMDYDIRCYTAHPDGTGNKHEVAVSVNAGKIALLHKSFNQWNPANPDVIPASPPINNQEWFANGNSPLNDVEDIITISYAGFATLGLSLSGTISIRCQVKSEVFEKWQTKIYNLIMMDYNRRLEAYKNSRKVTELSVRIKGRNPFLNREIERNEFKRHVIAILMCNYFNGIGSMMEKVAPAGYPEIDFQKLEKDAPVIQFFEQVFEWNYITYLFYHSMWARKEKWAELIDEDSGDPLFDKFLMAGAARIQVPVRPGMEKEFCWFLHKKQIWQGKGEPPLPGDDEYISMIQELKESKQCDFNDRPGLIDATNGSNILKLTNSPYYMDASLVPPQINAMNLDNDIDRQILVDYKLYRIVKIEQTNTSDLTAWDITIERSFQTASAKNLKHGVGAKYVGAPWEIVIPTKLVYLRNKTDKLPVYPLT